jgi:hypothetical protein
VATLAELVVEDVVLSLPTHQRPSLEVVKRVVELAYLRLSQVEGLQGLENAAQLAHTGGFSRCARCGAIWQVVDLVTTDDDTLACVECEPGDEQE